MVFSFCSSLKFMILPSQLIEYFKHSFQNMIFNIYLSGVFMLSGEISGDINLLSYFWFGLNNSYFITSYSVFLLSHAMKNLLVEPRR